MMGKFVSDKLGNLLLGIWLIITGLVPLVNVPIPGLLMSVLALAAGVLIIAGR